MVPKESGFNLSETAWGLCSRLVWRFLYICSPAMARDGEIVQKQHFSHYGDTICHPRPGYVTTRLHGTSTADATICDIFRQSYFHVSYRRRMPATLMWLRQSTGGSCQSSEMATLLNSLSFVFKISFLPKYRVIYYDYIVKWCSGI